METGFNSRTRGACDTYFFLIFRVALFQFTHARGVRHAGLDNLDALELFQFTHARGVRPVRMIMRVARRVFQFTHARGVRLSD